MGQMKYECRVLVGKPHGIIRVGIKMNIKNIYFEEVSWI
jgi:hypothetical protein